MTNNVSYIYSRSLPYRKYFSSFLLPGTYSNVSTLRQQCFEKRILPVAYNKFEKPAVLCDLSLSLCSIVYRTYDLPTYRRACVRTIRKRSIGPTYFVFESFLTHIAEKYLNHMHAWKHTKRTRPPRSPMLRTVLYR
jgi:hypothetical protein